MKKNICTYVFAATLCISTGYGYAAQVAYTSFEDVNIVNGMYVDLGNSANDHDLVNHSGEAVVNWTSTGREIGFASYYRNTRSGEGLTDGDVVGVTNRLTDVTSFTDGDQGFTIGDPDGVMGVQFDRVLTTSNSQISVSLDLFVAETSWESNDNIRVWLELSDGSTRTLMDTSSSDIDNLGIEGQWNALEQSFNSVTSAELYVEFDANAAAELIYIDNVRFTSPVPLPAPLVLLGSGLIGLGFFRKKKT